MASSGYYRANGITVGSKADNHIFLNWSVAAQEVGNNRSLISWEAYAHFNNADSQLDNGDVWCNVGTLWDVGGRVKNFDGNYTTRNVGLASGSFWIGHDGAGNAQVQFGAGITFFDAGRSEAVSEVWSLPTIPRHGDITNFSGNFNDTNYNPWVEFSNPAGGTTQAWFELPDYTGSTRYAQRNDIGSRHTWTLTEGEMDSLRNAIGNATSATIHYKYANYVGGSWVVRAWGATFYKTKGYLTSLTGTFTDTSVSAAVVWTNNGSRIDLKLEAIGQNPFKRWSSLAGTSGTFTLSLAERNSLTSYLTTANTTNLRWTITTVINGVDTHFSYVDKTYQIQNANPTFTTISYADTNPATTAITGNNQYIIQNKSTLRTTVPVANKAVAIKYATMNKYTMKVAGLSTEKSYSGVADVYNDFGVINATTNQGLTITAVDSRNNQSSVTNPINVVPYAVPTITATAARVNNFEATTAISISGTMSLLQVAGVTKNAVNSTSGVQYRYREDQGTWGSWVNVASATSGATISTTSFNLTLDNTKVFNFEVKITDKLSTVTSAFNVAAGNAIFRIGTDGYVYNNEEKIVTNHHKAKAILNCSTTTFAMNWDIAWVALKVPLNTISSEYDPYGKLTLDSNGIKIGAGISKVLVSGVFGIYNSSNGNDTIPQIYKNSTSLGYGAYLYAQTTAVLYDTMPLKPTVLDVVENDIIYMYCAIGGAGSRTLLGLTTLMVEVIK